MGSCVMITGSCEYHKVVLCKYACEQQINVLHQVMCLSVVCSYGVTVAWRYKCVNKNHHNIPLVGHRHSFRPRNPAPAPAYASCLDLTLVQMNSLHFLFFFFSFVWEGCDR